MWLTRENSLKTDKKTKINMIFMTREPTLVTYENIRVHRRRKNI